MMYAMPDSSESPPVEARPRDVDDNGVDLTLVRYSLSLNRTQRLQAVENFMRDMATVRRPTPLKAPLKK